MNVSFSIGEQSKAVIEKIKTSADSVDFYSYPTIQDMIKEATLRHINFKRVIFSTKILKDVEGDLRVLNEFIRNYSNSTEIVMIILDKNNTEYDEVFSAIFNSPLYTPAFMSKATVTNLVSLVQDNIEDIRAKFYSLDKGVKDKMIVSSSATESSEVKKAQESSQSNPVSQKEEKKGGFLSGLFGGKKKTSRNQETVPEVVKPATEATKVGETVAEKVEDFSNGPQSVFTGFGGVSDTFGNSSENNSSQNIFEPNGGSSPIGDEDFTSKNSEIEDDEEDFLSVGDYGEQHSDTGFLDEEEEDDDPELKAFLASKKGQPETLTEDGINEDIEEEKNDFEDVMPEVEEPRKENISVGIHSGTPAGAWRNITPKKEVQHTVSPREEINHKDVKPSKQANIDLICGVRGSQSSSAVADEAVDLATSKGAKVLVVDLDYKENGILAFIDTQTFYAKGYSLGISRLRVYTEDNVSVISNGYGSSVTVQEVRRLFSSGIFDKYDEVIIDCPIECLDVFDLELLRKCYILIYTGADRSDLIATSTALVDRSVIDLDVERYIMNNCSVDFSNWDEVQEEDIDYLKETCLFANGCWLDKIALG